MLIHACLLIVVVITTAGVSEQAGVCTSFGETQFWARYGCTPLSEAYRFHRLIKIWVDAGYRGKDFMHWVIDVYRWILSVVTRKEEQKGFVVLPKLGKVERTFGWFNWCRRLSKDYEVLPETTEAFI